MKSSRSSLLKNLLKYTVAILLLGLVIGLNWGSGTDSIAMFATSDINGDGKISREEASLQLLPVYDQYDTNKDGFIDAGEYKKFLIAVGDFKPGLKHLNYGAMRVDLLALATILYIGIIVSQYIRWWMLVQALGLPFRLRDAVRLGMVGTFYNTFLPGSIGGDFVKAYFIAKGEPQRKAAAVATVVADRLLGLFGLLLYGAAVGGGFWISGDPNINDESKGLPLRVIIEVCSVLAGIGAITYIVIVFLPESAQQRFAARLARVPKFGATLSELWFTAVQYGQRPRVVLQGVVLSAFAHTLMMLSFHYAVRVFPPDDINKLATLPEHFVILPIGYIFQALVPLPGGLGFSELSFGGLYELIGRGPAEGVAGRLSLRLIEWGLGLVCYVAYLRMKTELPATESPPDAR